MSKDIWFHYIQDILHSVNRIVLKTKDLDLEIFENDEDLQDIVIRNFIVIGEAAANIPHNVKNSNQDVPWRKMKGMRNFVIHEYKTVKYSLILKTAKEDIPPLKS